MRPRLFRRLQSPVAAGGLLMFPHQARLKATGSLEERLAALEREATYEGIVKYFSHRSLTKIDVEGVVRACADPGYRPHVFTHRELPIMVAHMIQQLDNLPCGLSSMPACKIVRQDLLSALLTLSDAPLPTTEATETAFIEVIQKLDESIIEPILTLMARGVLELRREVTKHRRVIAKAGTYSGDDFKDESRREIQAALDEFNTLLIQYKFLSRQLCALGLCRTNSRYIGLIDTQLDLVQLVSDAMHDARAVCMDHYGDAPELLVVTPQGDKPAPFPHWGESISYCIKEIGKNAFRATVEAHMKKNEVGIVTCDDMPPIIVTLGFSAEGFCSVCVSDEGGGISRRQLGRVMTYTFTTSSNPLLAHDTEQREDARQMETSGALAGYGYGLPMSRVYARCFGGDLQLHSMEGFGTRAFLHLRRSFGW